jgi:hypothetical protein
MGLSLGAGAQKNLRNVGRPMAPVFFQFEVLFGHGVFILQISKN